MTPDEALDYLIVASCGRSVPTAVTASECGQVIRADLARLRGIEAAARDRCGATILAERADAALLASLDATPGLSPAPPPR